MKDGRYNKVLLLIGLALITVSVAFLISNELNTQDVNTNAPLASPSASSAELVYLNRLAKMDDKSQITFSAHAKTYYIDPKDSPYFRDIANKTVDEVSKSTWGIIVQKYLTVAKDMYSNLGKGYSIVIIDPVNKSHTLLTTIDKEVVYNILEDRLY